MSRVVRIVRCPLCGSTEASVRDNGHETWAMKCNACGNGEVVDSWHYADMWNLDIELPEGAEVPGRFAPLAPMASAQFELRGRDGDETRTVIHPIGYSLAIGHHPRALPAPSQPTVPRTDLLIALADVPVELGLRMDEITPTLSPENTVVTALLAYAQSRASRPGLIKAYKLDGALLPPGADAAMGVSYQLRGTTADAMEILTISVKAGASKIHAAHVTLRFNKSAPLPFEPLSLLGKQSWI